MLTLQILGTATLGVGIAAALAFGASEAAAKSASANCWDPHGQGMVGYCTAQADCGAICAALGLSPGRCVFVPSEGANCCFCEI
jgi:hypothetical protein